MCILTIISEFMLSQWIFKTLHRTIVEFITDAINFEHFVHEYAPNSFFNDHGGFYNVKRMVECAYISTQLGRSRYRDALHVPTSP